MVCCWQFGTFNINMEFDDTSLTLAKLLKENKLLFELNIIFFRHSFKKCRKFVLPLYLSLFSDYLSSSLPQDHASHPEKWKNKLKNKGFRLTGTRAS
jgi:hypothetical protein